MYIYRRKAERIGNGERESQSCEQEVWNLSFSSSYNSLQMVLRYRMYLWGCRHKKGNRLLNHGSRTRGISTFEGNNGRERPVWTKKWPALPLLSFSSFSSSCSFTYRVCQKRWRHVHTYVLEVGRLGITLRRGGAGSSPRVRDEQRMGWMPDRLHKLRQE